jgi:A/G-specific adenine glycosylase
MKSDYIAESDRLSLYHWYRQNRRPLPWRANRDPYRIWVSEVMLQQTTVTAVIPYYERFLERFATVDDLAKATIEDVYALWAGLGYYSRARNLHKAAQKLRAEGFARRASELEALPGFGSYTSRAVASLAFGEKVGVLDGNVIRILCRRFGLDVEWWRPKARAELQRLADLLANTDETETAPGSADINQAMMELGATVCTPQSTRCLLCPWSSVCVARHENRVAELPLRKPRREREIWIWNAQVTIERKRVRLIKTDETSFLRGHWILPGSMRRAATAPKKFAIRGAVTHHDIYVNLSNQRFSTDETADDRAANSVSEAKWVKLDSETLKREVLSSLVRKAIQHALKERGLAIP